MRSGVVANDIEEPAESFKSRSTPGGNTTTVLLPYFLSTISMMFSPCLSLANNTSDQQQCQSMLNMMRVHAHSSIAHWVERSAVNREARGSERRRAANF